MTRGAHMEKTSKNNITFKDFMEMYSNWNGITKVNDDNLNEIVKGKTHQIMFIDGKLYNPNIMEKKVVAFAFYDNELCVRVK